METAVLYYIPDVILLSCYVINSLKIINKNYHRKQEYLHLMTSEQGDCCISVELSPGMIWLCKHS